MANNLTQTTLSAAISVNQNTFTVASTTNIVNPTNGFFQKIYVLDPGSLRGELMTVLAVPVSGTIQVSRLDQFKMPHLASAIVIINPVDPTFNGFVEFEPNAGLVPPTPPGLTWIVNVVTGNQWLWSTVTNSWVPGFNNTSAPLSPVAALASAAGLVTPPGPLFHMTGALAVTGFNAPLGFTSGEIRIINDGIWTWTAANNIAVAGTVTTVGTTIMFVYDPITAKWYPSRVA